ncbi:MAG: hypothetical protein RIQ53_3975 [Pseudomonadota bacterium]|jgi:DNA ligase-1
MSDPLPDPVSEPLSASPPEDRPDGRGRLRVVSSTAQASPWLVCPLRRRLLGAGLGLLLTRAAQAAAPLPLMLAREWPADADPAGHLVSEKFDGLRALWDGERLRLRSGALVLAPDGFTRDLPPLPLDGELWAGRGRFEEASATVRAARPDAAAWRRIRFQVFELPAGGGRYVERAAQLQQLCADAGLEHLVAVTQRPVQDRAGLQRCLDDVLVLGGEGVMLHHADAPVATGRHAGLWKHKPLHDAEATVIAHLPGQGRLQGLLGALQVRGDDGVVFAIGTGLSDAQRADPPPPGSRVTYTHRGRTAAGVPRHASFLRVRPPG